MAVYEDLKANRQYRMISGPCKPSAAKIVKIDPKDLLQRQIFCLGEMIRALKKENDGGEAIVPGLVRRF
jgi:hypothetical protein